MKMDVSKFPSNKKFGLFFSIVFLLLSFYFYSQVIFISYSLIFLSLIFLVFAIIKSEILLPFNKMWMSFGFLLGKVISPIVLGIIFFGIFVPYSFILKMLGRDENET